MTALPFLSVEQLFNVKNIVIYQAYFRLQSRKTLNMIQTLPQKRSHPNSPKYVSLPLFCSFKLQSITKSYVLLKTNFTNL